MPLLPLVAVIQCVWRFLWTLFYWFWWSSLHCGFSSAKIKSRISKLNYSVMLICSSISKIYCKKLNSLKKNAQCLFNWSDNEMRHWLMILIHLLLINHYNPEFIIFFSKKIILCKIIVNRLIILLLIINVFILILTHI